MTILIGTVMPDRFASAGEVGVQRLSFGGTERNETCQWSGVEFDVV